MKNNKRSLTAIRNSRTNQEWLNELSGANGKEIQDYALLDLANYLHAVTYNHLIQRKKSNKKLSIYPVEEIANIAEDFVQRFFEKLVRNDFELLTKYHGTGAFIAWAAQLLKNMISSEMRKIRWHREEILGHNSVVATQFVPALLPPKELFPGLKDQIDILRTESKRSEKDGRYKQAALFKKYEQRTALFSQKISSLEQNHSLEQSAIQGSIMETVQNGLSALPERYRVVLTRCLIEGESVSSVADDLQTTQNAVHILVHNATKQLRESLINEGLDQSVIQMFA